MRLHIKTLTGKDLWLDVEKTTTFREVKQKILNEYQKPTPPLESLKLENLRLIVGQKEVDDDSVAIGDYPDFMSYEFIYLMLRLLDHDVTPLAQVAPTPANEPQKLLVLDVEGTIISGYEYNSELPGGRFPAIIDSDLKAQLQRFKDAGFIIVLATGTDGDNLQYYQSQFAAAGISQLIDGYSPLAHDREDSKADKLNKYREQYQTTTQSMYFYDDGLNNVTAAKAAGYVNSSQVSDTSSLVRELSALANTLNLDARSIARSGAATNVGSTAAVRMFPPTQTTNAFSKVVMSALQEISTKYGAGTHETELSTLITACEKHKEKEDFVREINKLTGWGGGLGHGKLNAALCELAREISANESIDNNFLGRLAVDKNAKKEQEFPGAKSP